MSTLLSRLSRCWIILFGLTCRCPTNGFSATPTRYTIPSSTQGKVLCQDPLIYVIPNLLDRDECQAYQNRVLELQDVRPMTQSNPPQVSLELAKLWPLSITSCLAGIPPVWRRMGSEDGFDLTTTILSVAVPPILVALAASLALAYGVVLPLVRKRATTAARTSQAMALNLAEDVDFCRGLVDRVCLWTGHPWTAWEAPVVTRYPPGAIFARHNDASPRGGTEWADSGGQRVVTCICYLNDIQGGGGETSFDRLKLDVVPRRGDALIFFPADPVSRQADPRTTHESLPPADEKWIVQMFGRIGPRVPPPLGLPDSFGTNEP